MSEIERLYLLIAINTIGLSILLVSKFLKFFDKKIDEGVEHFGKFLLNVASRAEVEIIQKSYEKSYAPGERERHVIESLSELYRQRRNAAECMEAKQDQKAH